MVRTSTVSTFGLSPGLSPEVVFSRYFGFALSMAGLVIGLAAAAALAQPGGRSLDLVGGLACGSPATAIHDIQGDATVSPFEGTVVTIEGLVVGDFQQSDQLNGFFLQQTVADADPATSEGIFVYEGGSAVEVAVGDRVRVTGLAREFYDLTELTDVGSVTVCATGQTIPTPTSIQLPLANGRGDFERWEGMLVAFEQSLVVTETHDLARFGEAVLAWPGTDPFLLAPTQVAEPGARAAYRESLNERSVIVLDDGSTRSRPDPVPLLEGFDPERLRRGARLAEPVVGVLNYSFGDYKLEPTSSPLFDETLPRPARPDVGGDVAIASFNLLNWFTTLDDGQNGARGADSIHELARQEQKLVTALCLLDADIVGLQELENDGSSILELVSALDAACPDYEAVDTGVTGDNLGGIAVAEVITVGLLYRPASVIPVGSVEVLETGSFDGRSRPPVAQSFAIAGSGESPFTVVVNHFKSKGCSGASGSDLDQGDGQSCYNNTRVSSSLELAAWLATDPTDSGSSDVLVLGDLNAYALEDPIAALEAAGLVDLFESQAPHERHSFVFDGQAGSLDHAVVSPSLLSRVTAASVWHVNADEARALDYNDAVSDPGDLFDEANQDTSLFVPDQHRSSDHDPLIIGLRLGSIFVDGFESGDVAAWSGESQ